MGFRPFIYRLAVRNGLAGYVRNRGDAGVEVLLEGDAQGIERFMEGLAAEKPPLAQIDKIAKTELSGKNKYQNFTIIKSSQEAETSGSIIPPDIAICNQCLKELRDPKDPRLRVLLHHLHQLRTPLHHHRAVALRPREHHHARVSTVRFLPKRV